MDVSRSYTGRVSDIAENLLRVRQQVDETAANCDRDPAEIRILAVSKTMPSNRILEAYACGQRMFGENRVQEVREKIPGIEPSDIIWHFIGHLQSNKSRIAVELFDVIQSVDSAKLAKRLNRHCEELGKALEIFIQVNISGESRKSGIGPEQVPELVRVIEQLPNLHLSGLMTIPPFFEDPEKVRPYFRRMKELQDELNQDREQPLWELSMGMSGDFRVAVEEGATIIRLGTVIFGPRTTT